MSISLDDSLIDIAHASTELEDSLKLLDFSTTVQTTTATTATTTKTATSLTMTPATAHGAAFSASFTHYAIMVNLVCLCPVIATFGILANVINMVVLRRQGFQETVNTTLFAIALSDLVSLLTTLWVSVCYNPLWQSAGGDSVRFRPREVQFLTGEMPHVIAMNVTSWLTAFVTLERCLCVAFPLKVKAIVTAGRVKAIVVGIFVVVIASQAPTFYVNSLGWKFDPDANRTVLGVVPGPETRSLFDALTLYLANVVGPFLSFTIIVLCSGILVIKLNRKSRWRRGVAKSSVTAATSGGGGGSGEEGQSDVMTSRDRRVMKMVVTVAVIFIATFTPSIVIFANTAANPQVTATGPLANNYFVAVSFAFVFETVNASVNVFVYYTMSSKFKAIFRSMFFREAVKA